MSISIIRLQSRVLLLRFISCLLACSLALSATGGVFPEGVKASSRVLNLILAGKAPFQDPELPDFSETPGPIEYGDNPARDDVTQNGAWTTAGKETLYDLEQQVLSDSQIPITTEPVIAYEHILGETPGYEEEKAKKLDRIADRAPDSKLDPKLVASTAPTGQAPLGTIGAGMPYPWEMALPGGGSNSINTLVNSNTGNRLTVVPIMSMGIRGGLDLSFNLYHNTKTVYDSYLGYKWSSDLDARVQVNHSDGVYSNTNKLVVRWGDGQAVEFTYNVNTGKYLPPAGFYDTAARTSGSTHNPIWTITKKSGVKYVFKPKISGTVGERSGLLLSIEDRDANKITIERVATSGRPILVKDLNDRRIHFTYDYTNSKVIEIRDSKLGGNRKWNLVYTSGMLTQIKYPLIESGDTIKSRFFAYQTAVSSPSYGNILSETDRRGKVWTCSYHWTTGALQYFSSPLPNTEFELVFYGSYTTLKDPLNLIQRHNYTSGRIVSTVDEGGFGDKYTFDTLRRPASYTDRREKVWLTEFDVRGNVTKTTTPTGEHEFAAFNTDNTVSTTWGDLSPSDLYYGYNSTGRLTSVSKAAGAPDAQLFTAAYLSGGLTSATTYGANFSGTNSFAYTTYGDLNKVTDPGSMQHQASVNEIGWTTSTTNPAAKTTTITRDGWGRAKQITYHGGTNVQITYDAEKQCHPGAR